MAKECLEYCPNIKWCEIGLNMTGSSSAFLPGVEFSMRRAATTILEDAKRMTENCSGPIPVPTVITKGILYPRQITKIVYQCPQTRQES